VTSDEEEKKSRFDVRRSKFDVGKAINEINIPPAVPPTSPLAEKLPKA
jgi:hypothetical protein